MNTKVILEIGPYKFSERELSQIIRRKMICKSFKNKKKFNKKHNRKPINKNFEDE